MRFSDLFQIFALNLWLAMAFLAGRGIWRVTRIKSLAIAASIAIVIAPYWNVWPAYVAYRDAVAKDGGTHITRRFTDTSFLIKHPGRGEDVLMRCGSSIFCDDVLYGRLAVAELPETPADPNSPTQFVRIWVGEVGDPRCAELAKYSAIGDRSDFLKLPPGHCLATERASAATSRYSVEEEHEGSSQAWNNVPLRRAAIIVRETGTDRIVAQSVRYVADPLPLWPALPNITFDNHVADLTIEALRR